MKPERTVTLIILFAVALVGVFFLESLRQAHKVYEQHKSIAKEAEARFSNNDYILFQSISKYLFAVAK